MAEPSDDGYLIAFACGSLVLASHIRDVEQASSRPKAATRASKMARVINAKISAWQQLGETDPPSPQRLGELAADWSTEDRRRFLVDLAMSDPFSPYSLKFGRGDLLEGLQAIAAAIGETPGSVDEIETVRKAAAKSHASSRIKRVGAIGLATAVALGSAGWLAAPAIATALGTAAGLTGAAATAHGLALLGGGSLAAGGFGMAGGMWIVAGTAATAGIVGGSGSALMYELGAMEARSELIKLQVTFRIAVLGTQTDLRKAQETITSLADLERELRAALETERELNDENSARVKELASKVDDLVAARAWMEAEANRVA